MPNHINSYTVKLRDGQTVPVHQVCQTDARLDQRVLTAAPPGYV